MRTSLLTCEEIGTRIFVCLVELTCAVWLSSCGIRMVSTPSVEPLLKSRLLPRFSFRFLFVLTLVFALLGVTVQAAYAGYAVAISVLAFIGFLAAFFAACVVVFLVLWCLSGLRVRGDDADTAGSPFADGQLPPQILPPSNPST